MVAYAVVSTIFSLALAVAVHYWQRREREAWMAKADARIIEAVLAKLAQSRVVRDAATAQSVAGVRAAGDAAKTDDTVEAANRIIGGK